MSCTVPYQRKDAGFTLVELLVVLSILAMSYFLISPLYFGAGSTVKLKAVTSKIVNDLRLLKTRSVMTGKIITVEILKDAKGYQVSDREKKFLLSKELIFNKSTSSPIIHFFPDGTCTNFILTIVSGEQKRIIKTEKFTSRIMVQ